MLFSDQRIAERVVLVIIFNERAGELLPLLDPEPLGERAGRDVAHDHLDRHDFHLPHKLFAHVEAADEMGRDTNLRQQCENMLGNAVIQYTLTADGAFFLRIRSEEHTSELQSLMRISYALFCFKNKK